MTHQMITCIWVSYAFLLLCPPPQSIFVAFQPCSYFCAVLEYVEGKPVFDDAGPPGCLGEETARKYIRDVVCGLIYLHAHVCTSTFFLTNIIRNLILIENCSLEIFHMRIIFHLSICYYVNMKYSFVFKSIIYKLQGSCINC